MDNTSSDSAESQELGARFARVFEESFRLLAKSNQTPPGHHFFKDLSVNQIRAMHIIFHQPGVAQKELAEKMELTAAAISTAVSHMTRLGLVERKPHPNDARAVCLFLNETASRMIEENQAMRARAAASLLEGLTLEEQIMVVEAMERALHVRRERAETGPPQII